jgi:hypothetical protein
MENLMFQRRLEEKKAPMHLQLLMEGKEKMLLLLVQLHRKSRRRIRRVNQ